MSQALDDEDVGPVRVSLKARAAALVRAGVLRLGDTIVPPVCVACHAPLSVHHALCADCWVKVDFIQPPLCDRLGIPLGYDTGGLAVSARAMAEPPDFDRARGVAAYGGTVQKLIHDFKYADRHDGRQLFGRWLITAGAPLLADCDVMIPLPLNRWRMLHRRFNQSAVLAMEVSRLTGKVVAPLALVRTRRTRQQVGLSMEERRANVAKAFTVPERWRGRIAGKRVLLVDDVITTGATVNSAARALKEGGARAVDVLALAIVTGG